VIPAERCWLQVADAALDAAFQALGAQSPQRLAFAAREAFINALQVIEEQGGDSEIEIQLSSDDGWIEIRVTDPGPGLPEGWRLKLDDPPPEDSLTSLSGRGLMFIRRFVDELSSERDTDGRHILIMRKRRGEC